MYTPYILAGHLSLGVAVPAVYQLLRLACGGACLWAMAQFCRLFSGPYALRAVWLFVLCAGGLYWLALPLSGLGIHIVEPAALTAPELNPLITMLISPHESLGLAAELLGFTALLRSSGATDGIWNEQWIPRPQSQGQERRQIAIASASFLVLALSYPFLLPTVGLVGLAHAWITARGAINSRLVAAAPRRRLRTRGVLATETRTLAVALGPALIVGIYYANIFRRDPLWSHSGLAQVGRPDLAVLVFAFGPLALGAYLGIRRLRAALPGVAPAAWAWFPLTWAAVNACTLALPIWQQGRQALGLSIPLALLSFAALAGPGAFSRRARIHLPPLPAVALAFSAPVLLALYTAVTAGGVNHNYYAPQGISEAVTWLGGHARPADVVLSSAGFGNLVPAVCPCRVLVGQNFQSFNFTQRQAEVRAFYAAPSAGAAQRVLIDLAKRERISLVVAGPYERSIGPLNVAGLHILHLRYRAHGVSIFSVRATRP